MSQQLSSRRDFLQATSAFAALLSWHPPSYPEAQDKLPPSKEKASGKGRFTSLRLQATRLDELLKFYTNTLGLTLHAQARQSFTILCGETLIEFQQAEKQEPFYHFAFNIPENKFKLAKNWLEKRCPLLKDSHTSADELFFKQWNAHAVYFQDPSGNIGELIARHTLANAREGGFDVPDILYVSEIGLVSAEPARFVGGLRDVFGLKPYLGNEFFVGDEYGLFVLPPVGRPWIPERRQKAAIFVTDVTITGHGKKELRVPNCPYLIRGEV
jgi:hypothetical protein